MAYNDWSVRVNTATCQCVIFCAECVVRWCEGCYEVSTSRGQRWNQLCATAEHVLYEYEATISNKVLSDDRPRRFSDKPEFFETVCISNVRELRISTLYFTPMQVFRVACLSWLCVRWITVWDKAGAIPLFHWGTLRETMETVRIVSGPVDISKRVPPEDEELRWKVVFFYRRDPFLESSICGRRQIPTDRNLNTSTTKVWKLVFKISR